MRKKVLLIISIALVIVLLASLILSLALEIRKDDSRGKTSSSSSSTTNQPESGDQTGSSDQTGDGETEGGQESIQKTITIETDIGTCVFDTTKNYLDLKPGSCSAIVREEKDGELSYVEDAATVFDDCILLNYPYFITGITIGKTEPVSGDVYAFFYVIIDPDYPSGGYILVDGADVNIKGDADGDKIKVGGVNETGESSIPWMGFDVYLEFPLEGEMSADGFFNDGLPSMIEIYMFCGKIL